jgi:TPR repeat protein
VWIDSFLDNDYISNNNGRTILAYFGLHFLYPEKYNNPIGVMEEFCTNLLGQMEYCLRLENYDEFAKRAIKAYNTKNNFPDYQHEKIDVAMGRCYLAGWGVARDTERAKKLLCQYPSGKAYLADAHYNGWCVPYDLAEAYRLCKESEGEYISKYVLAHMHLNGFYVKQDEEKGIQYLIDGGYNYKYGANLLAYYYHVGAIVDKDEMQAIRYYTCALNDGNGGAGNNMGLIYEYSPVYKNEQKAFNCYYRSAHCKDSGGAISLGRCYENGFGCPMDKKKALEMYKIAKRWGNGEAQKFIDNLNNQGIY